MSNFVHWLIHWFILFSEHTCASTTEGEFLNIMQGRFLIGKSGYLCILIYTFNLLITLWLLSAAYIWDKKNVKVFFSATNVYEVNTWKGTCLLLLLKSNIRAYQFKLHSEYVPTLIIMAEFRWVFLYRDRKQHTEVLIQCGHACITTLCGQNRVNRDKNKHYECVTREMLGIIPCEDLGGGYSQHKCVKGRSTVNGNSEDWQQWVRQLWKYDT